MKMIRGAVCLALLLSMFPMPLKARAAGGERVYPVNEATTAYFVDKDGKRISDREYMSVYSLSSNKDKDAGYTALIKPEITEKVIKDGTQLEYCFITKDGVESKETYGYIGRRGDVLYGWNGNFEVLLDKVTGEQLTDKAYGYIMEVPGESRFVGYDEDGEYLLDGAGKVIKKLEGKATISTFEAVSCMVVAQEDGNPSRALVDMQTGERLTGYAYVDIVPTTKDGLLIVTAADGKLGLMNRKGENVLAPEYLAMTPGLEGQYLAKDELGWGVIDSTGKFLFRMDKNEPRIEMGFYVSPDAYGYINVYNRDGDMIVPPAMKHNDTVRAEYLNVWDYGDEYWSSNHESIRIMRVFTEMFDSQAIIIDREGKEKWFGGYMPSAEMLPGLYSCYDKDGWGMMNDAGDWIIPPIYTNIFCSSENLESPHIQATIRGGRTFFFDKEGKPYQGIRYNRNVGGDVYEAYQGLFEGLCDSKGNWIVKKSIYSSLAD